MTTKRTTGRRDAFDPNQERDENGRWAGGAGVEAASARSQGAHQSAHVRHAATAKEAAAAGRPREAKAHRLAAEYHVSAAAKIASGDPRAKEESANARKATQAAFAAGRASSTGANSPRVQEQVFNAIQKQRQAKLQAAANAGAEKRHEALVGRAAVREMESRRAAITGNIKPPSGNEPSREERRRALTERPTVTRDPSKPYGTTEETRMSGGRSFKALVQNKPEPLRYQGKSIREKEEQYQKDLTRMRERQAARNAERGPTKIMERERQPGFKIPPPPGRGR